jgi:uncharacterized protein YgiM (DUF1202 family)
MFLEYSSSQHKLFLFSHTDYKIREDLSVKETPNVCSNVTQTTDKTLTAIINIKQEFDGQQKVSYTSAERTKQCQVHLHI